MHYIAIDAGATRTRAALYEKDDLIAEAEGGPCNPVAYGWDASLGTVCALVAPWAARHKDCMVLAGIAGAADAQARQHAAQQLANRLGHEARVTEDVWATLHANASGRPAILAIAGTGSNTAGFNGNETWLQLGGRGHVYGDEGSAYAIGVAGLRAQAYAEEGLAEPTALQHTLLKATGCQESTELIAWSGAASKADVAGLALVVLREAEAGDSEAKTVVKAQAFKLAMQVWALGRKLRLDSSACLFLHGGLFDNSLYRHEFERTVGNDELREKVLRRANSANESDAWHAQRRLFQKSPLAVIGGPHAALSLRIFDDAALPHWLASAKPEEARMHLPVTESAAAGLRLLDEMTPLQVTESIAGGGSQCAAAVRQAAPQLADVIDAAAESIRSGGRILYVGAGTSGRLGVLDAAECPPTFGVSPDVVQGIIAGGQDAMFRSIEGAEDDAEAGARAMDEAGVGPTDTIVGIAASGNTPFVSGALARAETLGAVTALVTSNPSAATPALHRVNLDTGAEVLAGSTRMKAGTAAKLALNVISTGAMARAGYVYRGRMIGMRPVNNKLRARAVAMVAELAGVDEGAARHALEVTGYHIVSAILMARDGIDAEQAMQQAAAAASPRDALTQGADT